MKITISALPLLGLLLVSTAQARVTSVLEPGVFGGLHLFHPEGGVGRQSTSDEGQLAHGGVFGLRLGVELHPRAAAEAELAMAPTAAKLAPSAQVLGIGYRVQGLFHILTGRWRPFVLAGVGGFTTTTADRSIRQPDTTYSIPLGAGLKVDLTQYLGLRLDGRVLLQKGTPDGPALAPDGELTLGVFGRFGAARKAAAPSLSDRDRDGVADTVDLCPDLAGPPRRRGCPEASPALVPPPPVAPEPTTSVPLPALPPRPSAQ